MKVLVIEDHADNRRIARDIIQSAGHDVMEAASGQDGIAAAAAHLPDLILMDVQLPDMDGYEATRRLKADDALKHIPVIAVTAYALSGDDVKAYRTGCDGYLSKPFRSRDLLARVQSLLP